MDIKDIDTSITQQTGCKDITFNTITDYIILITFLLKSYGVNNKEINDFVTNYEKIIEEFRNKADIKVYNQVIYTNNKLKIYTLKNYVKYKKYVKI